MKYIALIGIGGIGKWHLQSLLTLAEEKIIYGVEPDLKTRTILEHTYYGRVEVKLVSSIEQLPSRIDIAIIATNSAVRRNVFEQLVKKSDCKNVIFEKVLFQKVDDYYAVKEILVKRGINAWVNCARREWPGYIMLHEWLRDREIISFSVKGGQWGLACNGIHMLDLITYLSGNIIESIDTSKLKDVIIESKRKGYYEIFGTLEGKGAKCGLCELTCAEEPLPCIIDIVFKDMIISVFEEQNIYRISYADNEWHTEEHELGVKYQSELTAKVVEQILNKGICRLPDYNEAMAEHIVFIKALTVFFEKHGMESGLCPIT